MGLRIVRIEFERTVQQQVRLLGGECSVLAQGPRSDAEIVGLQVRRPVPRRRDGQAACQCFDDLAADLILHGEDVLHAPVEPLGPKVISPTASISWALMRTRPAARRTLPSRM